MTFALTIKTAGDLAAEARSAERRRIKTRRNHALRTGTVVGGVAVQSDDLSQQRITGAALAATIDPQTSVNWKLADGSFAVLAAPQIIAIAQAVRAHVQACFDREAELLAALEADAAYDAESGWP